MDKTSILQVFAAITVVILLFVIGFAMYNRDMVKNYAEARKTKRVTPIFSGIMDFKGMHHRFETLDPLDPTYVNLNPSINQRAGAEFTYNFWLYQASAAFTQTTASRKNQADVDAGLMSDELVLLLKGDEKTVNYPNVCGKEKSDIYVKCPLIKLAQNGDVLVVELNTVQGVDGVRENARNVCNDITTNWSYANGHRLAIRNMRTDNLLDKWYMVTVVVQDTSPDDPLPVRNKVRVRVYINGFLELDRFVDGKIDDPNSVVRQNTGNLFIHATADSKAKRIDKARHIMMADLTYYNYAVEQSDINALVKKSFQKKFLMGCSTGVNARDKQLMNNMSMVQDVDNKLVPF